MTDFEQRLARLREDVVFPPTPDLAGAVAARIAAEPTRRPRPRWAPARLRPATVALAAAVAVLALAATLAASPGVRARIADWLGIGAVRIERVERLPDTSPAANLGLGQRTTLARAHRVAGVPVPTIRALGAPDAVYLDTALGGGSVALVYVARPGLPRSTSGIGALLTVIRGGEPEVVKKLLDAGPAVTSVDVDGALGVFIEGEHVVVPPQRLAGNTLLWVRGDATYRLETALGRAAALRLARSVR
jgi:hypothetical protein